MDQSQKKIVFLIIVCIIIFNSCILSRIDRRQNSEYQMAKRITRDELPMFFSKIEKGTEQLYGFSNRDELLTAGVGNPFNNYRFNGSELEKSTTITVPVIVADEYRALSSLDYIKDTLHIVDFGATVLAKEIQLVQKENITLSFVGLLRIYRIDSDFVIMSDNHENLFLPLTSAKLYLSSAGISKIEKFYTQAQILNIIQEIPNE
jgi:hypothetical protein